MVGRGALDFAEVGQWSEDDGPRRSLGGNGIDENDVPAVGPGDDRNEVLGDVLGVDDPDRRAGKARPDGSGDPWAESVIAAEDMADADEAGRLPEDPGQAMTGRGSLPSAFITQMSPP